MPEIIAKLANHTIRIRSLFPETGVFLKDYAAPEKEPECEISISSEDITLEREKSRAEDIKEGIPICHFSDAYLETLAVYRKIAGWMLERDIILFHGSAVAVDREAYLFTAKSGTGKSTHTRLWREVFGSRAVMVNDDKPLLEITSGGVIVHGTPWDGKHHLSSPIAVPLRGIGLLKRSEDGKSRIRPITAKEAFPMLLQQSYRPEREEKMRKSLNLVNRLMRQIPLYELSVGMNTEAVHTAYQGMKKGEKTCG